MPKFKIIKGKGLEAIIEKTEHLPTTFSLDKVKEHINAVKKTIKETDAKISLEEAMVKNIERNHPGLDTLSEELKQACYLLLKSRLAILPAQAHVDELKKSLVEYNEELKEIEDQTGLKI